MFKFHLGLFGSSGTCSLSSLRLGWSVIQTFDIFIRDSISQPWSSRMTFLDISLLNCIQHIFCIWIKYHYWSFVLHFMQEFTIFVDDAGIWLRRRAKSPLLHSRRPWNISTTFHLDSITHLCTHQAHYSQTHCLLLYCDQQTVLVTDETAGRCGRTTAMLLWMLAILVR